MPRPALTLSRRRMLVGAAALAALGVTAGCGRPPAKQDLDALLGQADRARSDARLAAAAAVAVPAPLAVVLTTVAAERTAHDQALTDELTRMNGAPPATSSPVPSPVPAAPPTAVPAPADVVTALQQSAEAAARAAAGQSGYRAGLLGSIAAACSAAAVVALAGSQPS